jgi:hypothetical protein
MYQILIAHKKIIVYATINSNEDWLLIHSLFNPLQAHRYSLQSLNNFISSCFNANTSPLSNVKDLLKVRIGLLSILIEILSKEKSTRSIEVLNAILYQQKKISSLLNMASNMTEQTILSKSQLEQWLAVLEITTKTKLKFNSDRREKLNFQQSNSFIHQSSQYGVYAYHYR